MIGRMQFNGKKFEELVVYLATRLGPEATLGRVKLMKLLMQADFTAYARLGRPITGATYEKWEYGHFAREWVIEEKNMTSNGAIIEEIVDYYGRQLRHIAALRAPDLSGFEEEELEIIEEALARYGHLSARALSEMAHREVGWRVAKYREEIPYNTVFLGTGAVTTEEIRRGQELASEHGWD
jgi:uncharacterized phage-associated protein